MDRGTYGRNRQSVAELEDRLKDLFELQRGCEANEDGIPTIPLSEVENVIRVFLQENDLDPLTEGQEEYFHAFAEANPNIRIDPTLLFGTLIQLTGSNEALQPQESDKSSSDESSPNQERHPRSHTLVGRGRQSDREDDYVGNSRSSSRDSSMTSGWDSRSSKDPNSPFETKTRQRSKPLDPPSSWSLSKKPTPLSRRRRSDASGGRPFIDIDEHATPSANRARAPSIPPSPGDSYSALPGSRPASRQAYQGYQGYQGYHAHNRSNSSIGSSHSSQEGPSPSPEPLSRPRFPARRGSVHSSTDDDSDDDNIVVPERISVASLASMADPEERLTALRKQSEEQQRRFKDSERHLQEDLEQREQEIADLQARLDRRQDELAAKTRDEKEMRLKERGYITSINNLETDVNKLQRNLETVRNQHQSLQKQYAEQIGESEKYRNQLRLRDNEVREFEHRELQHANELEKAARDREVLENQLRLLEADLQASGVAQAELEEQRQENILLKETIDRLRYDLDELRTSHATDQTRRTGSSGSGSSIPTLSRSLGSELARRLVGKDMLVEESTSEEGEGEGDSTIEKEIRTDGEEDVFQTIITRKRKVGAKGKKVDMQQKEVVLIDSATQYDIHLSTRSSHTQTDSEMDVARVSKWAQTDAISGKPKKAFRAPLSEQEERLAASSSTGRARHSHLHVSDEPPSYALSELEQSTAREDKVAMDVLRKWHGIKALGPLPNGISRDAIEDWNALKREMGVECAVIDKMIEQSERRGPRLSARERAGRAVEDGKNRFIKIYNTILVGDGAKAPVPGDGTGVAYSAAFIALGACSAVALMTAGGGGAHNRLITPGSPIYADRALWNSANAMVGAVGEGFGGGGPPMAASVSAVWHVLERLLLGATKVVTRT